MQANKLIFLAEPKRLQILELLRERPLPVKELTQRLNISQPQTSKHLHTLCDAGLVQVYPVAQQRFYGINPTALQEIYEWIGTFEPLWDTRTSIAARYSQAVREKQGQIVPTKTRPFKVSRTFAASRSMVWEALTTPLLLQQWFAPDYFTVPVCELDVHPGGALRIDLQAADGVIFPMVGVYKKVVHEAQLVFVSSPLEADGTKMFESNISISLIDKGEETTLKLEIYTLSSGPKAAQHLAGLQPGWEQNLANLDRLLTNSQKEATM